MAGMGVLSEVKVIMFVFSERGKAATVYCLVWLAEEEVGDGEGGDDADEVGDEATSNRMAGVLDADATKVNG